jgi:hypothetical protein
MKKEIDTYWHNRNGIDALFMSVFKYIIPNESPENNEQVRVFNDLKTLYNIAINFNNKLHLRNETIDVEEFIQKNKEYDLKQVQEIIYGYKCGLNVGERDELFDIIITLCKDLNDDGVNISEIIESLEHI